MDKTSNLSNNLIPYKVISSSKFPILLVKSAVDANIKYVLKVFIKDSSWHLSYLNEKQFLSSLKHSNIVNYVPSSSFKINKIQKGTKFILMEYAPYGDFFSLVVNDRLKSEKLIRTFFHQLIEGLEYLHKQGIAHLDIKLENLLLGKDLLLKIADFDVAQYVDDKNMVSQGSVNYRAPELMDENFSCYEAADIFSAGVCLFTMISKIFPFVEEGDENQKKFQSYEKFLTDNNGYWWGIETFLNKKINYSENLRELLNGMWIKDPSKRFSLEQIKSSKWYNLPQVEEISIRSVFDYDVLSFISNVCDFKIIAGNRTNNVGMFQRGQKLLFSQIS